MTTNVFFIANVKQLRTYIVLEFYCLFFRTSWCVDVLNSAILFNSFHNRIAFGTIFGGPSEFRGEGVEHLNPPRVRHWLHHEQLFKENQQYYFFCRKVDRTL